MRYATLSAVLVLASPVSGHHSDAGMDTDSVVALDGTVIDFHWRNPHVYIEVEVNGERDEPVAWMLQMGSTNVLTRNGWNPETLQPGDRVSVRGHPWRDGRPYALLSSIDKEGGLGLAARSGASDTAPSASTLAGKWRVDRSNLVVYPGGFRRLFSSEPRVDRNGKGSTGRVRGFLGPEPGTDVPRDARRPLHCSRMGPT